MAPNSLSPASVKINYHTGFGAHAMTVPTLGWFPTSITGTLGSYLAWDSTPRDAEAMINDLVDVLCPFLLPTTGFDLATVYTMATATSPNIPRASAVLTQVGTSVLTSPSEAVSCTFNFKTAANGDAKLVLLDSPIGSNWFNSILPASFGATVLALEAEFAGNSNAWSGRDDSDISLLRKISFDLNDKLQKLYRMT